MKPSGMSGADDGLGDALLGPVQPAPVKAAAEIIANGADGVDHVDTSGNYMGNRSATSEDDGEDIHLHSESDPLYPPPPPGYDARHEPSRSTHWLRLFAVLVALGLSCAAMSALVDLWTPPPGGPHTGRTEREIAEAVLGAMDRSADPCEDFYEYACGSWIRKNTIPKDRATYMKSFTVVHEEITREVRGLLENDLQNIHNKAGDFYASCLDQCAAGSLSVAPLYRFRSVFLDLSSPNELAFALGILHSNKSSGMFDIDIGVDEGSPDRYAVYLSQGGLGLPNKDDYTSTSDKGIKLRQSYLIEIQTMLSAAAKARLIPRFGHDILAERILEFETTLANVSLKPAERRDPFKSYNKRTISSLPQGLATDTYLRAAGIDLASINEIVILESPAYFDAVGQMMMRVAADVDYRRTVRAYLAFHLVRRMSSLGMLGETLFHANFKFKKQLYGVQQLEARWKMCQGMTTAFLGEAVAKAYVSKFFSDERRRVGTDMARNVIAAFEDNIDKQDWMDKRTRASAKEKLALVGVKIGYSSKLDTYDDARISPDNYASNVAAASAHGWHRAIKRLGGPIDRTEWLMDAHETNAYYSPPRNEIVIPAGILRQPFFSDAFPAAMNYGGLGSIVGHELSHGEDDAGHKYDATGRLRNWWSTKSSKAYDERAKCYVSLYDTYKPRDLDVNLLGNLTLGENLADINGIKVAYLAFQRAEGRKPSNEQLRGATTANSRFGLESSAPQMTPEPPPNKVLAHELSNNQLFFVSFAQSYCMLARPDALRVWITTDPHSPGRFRVQGTLSQTKEFSDAFQCRTGARYNPEKRCNLWV
jgi:putative endopeptidase